MSNKYLVVIVEDEYNISSFVSAVLQANGFDTMVARNGAEAIILITSHCPDLVLLDLGLPDMDGQGIIENVRGWSNVPIIVVSARTRERDKVMALESGADDYITKPFGTSELLARIRTALRHVQLMEGEQAQRQKIFLYSSIPDEQVRPMGMRSFSDMTELLKEAKLDGKSIYVIPNGATVVPHVC